MSDRRALVRVLALAALSASATLAAVTPAAAQAWATMKSARQLWKTGPVAVGIEYGAGTLEVRPANRPLLYEMDTRYDKRYVIPVADFDSTRRHLRLGIRARDGQRSGLNLSESSNASIKLTRQVPLDLTLQFGAGEADIDLGGVRLRKLDLSTGASETRVRFSTPNPIAAQSVDIRSGAADLTVEGLGNLRAGHVSFQGGVGSTTLDFSGQWNRNATASVQMGIGSVTLRLPRGLGVRIDRSSFLSSFDAPGLVKRGNSYFSPDWTSAAHQLTVEINAAFGSIEVEWI